MAQLGAACCTPAPRCEYAEKGKEESFGGVDVYVTRPDTLEAAAAVILISDVHGTLQVLSSSESPSSSLRFWFRSLVYRCDKMESNALQIECELQSVCAIITPWEGSAR